MNIEYVGSGRYADIFKLGNGRHTVICKLGFYRDSTLKEFAAYLGKGQQQKARTAKNADAVQIANSFGVLTNKLVQSVSPHFVVVYANIDGKNLAQKFAQMIPNRLRTASPTQLKYNNLCFMEPFSTDLTNWLRRGRHVTDETIRGALFGILYTLAALQKKYPNFRHNDLSTNNVLVKRLVSPKTYVYSVNGTLFMVTTPILVALSDYDFVHVPSVLENERVVSGKYKVTTANNNSYDTHFFLKTVDRVIKNKKNLQSTEAFLKSLPFQSQDRLDTKQIIGMDPVSLLQHPYFNSLRRSRKPAGCNVVFTM
jgi:hypothetical protein